MKRKTLILPMLLASCGTLPEPFYGDPGSQGAKLVAPAAPVLVVPTPTGALLGDKTAAIYANELAGALNGADVPSVARPAERDDWVLTTTAAQTGGNVIPTYAISGPDGKIYGTQTGTPVPAAAWANGDPAALNHATAADALALSKKLAEINAQVQQSNPNSLENRPPRVFMGTVTGAPGDGDDALALNMTRDLPSTQTELVKTAADADFTVTGIVKAQPDANHQMLVELDWIVTDASKRKIGQVTQLHDVAPTDIEPVWGDVAAAAATEAAAGVNEVIANATLHKPGQDIAVSSGPLAGGFSLAMPPTFALPPPGLSGAQLAAAFAPPAPATTAPAAIEVAAISEPLPVPAVAPPAAPRPAAAPAISAPPAPVVLAEASERLAVSRPAREQPEQLAELSAPPARPLPARAAPLAAPFRLAANTAAALFSRFASLFTQPAAAPAPAQDAVPATEASAVVASAQPVAAQPAAPQLAAPQPIAASYVASVAPVQVQPTVLITPVLAEPLPPAGSGVAAEYGATALITPVIAVPLPREAARRPEGERRFAAYRGRFTHSAPTREVAAPVAEPAVAAPPLPGLTAISDSQLWRVAVPIPVTFEPSAQLYRRLVYIIPSDSTPARSRHIIHSVFREHVHTVPRPAIYLAEHRMAVPAEVQLTAAQPPVAAPVAMAPAVSAPKPYAGPIESSYDVLER
jgi:hypothetical protein